MKRNWFDTLLNYCIVIGLIILLIFNINQVRLNKKNVSQLQNQIEEINSCECEPKCCEKSIDYTAEIQQIQNQLYNLQEKVKNIKSCNCEKIKPQDTLDCKDCHKNESLENWKQNKQDEMLDSWKNKGCK